MLPCSHLIYFEFSVIFCSAMLLDTLGLVLIEVVSVDQIKSQRYSQLLTVTIPTCKLSSSEH